MRPQYQGLDPGLAELGLPGFGCGFAALCSIADLQPAGRRTLAALWIRLRLQLGRLPIKNRRYSRVLAEGHQNLRYAAIKIERSRFRPTPCTFGRSCLHLFRGSRYNPGRSANNPM
jgi:hypothetical protein